MNKPWYMAVANCHEIGEAYVLVTVLGTSGSTPREPGAKMVVTAEHCYDTIGGGQLEYLVTQAARQRLQDGEVGVDMRPFPLAAEAKQCCGGHVSVMLEAFAPADWRLAVFGAGHVAQQLIPILARMPAKILWLDNRFDFALDRSLIPEGSNVELGYFEDPVDTILELPAATEVIILTHDHALDFELCKVALERPDIPFVGCIGSNTKAKRFEQRLLKTGLNESDLQRWVCPIGLPEVPGKLPIEVAVSISAQLVARRQLHSQHRHDRRGLAWRELKDALASEPENSSRKTQLDNDQEVR
ncbi:xanthine dehydrogenase accessory protein XdhC [Halioxenophilus aromaticivorans]|uniref:Xanthine dehydrogenase accessory protein XdhC n=1 Tax=Halioxenophilus aromaticivorans TaxID=1306992 RepID=A0AAV3TZK8_9ALTE